MATIYTIGFGGKGAEQFITLLRDHEIDIVIDTRRRPDSQLSGYAKQRDLPYLLRTIAGIGYEYMPALAPPDDLLSRYRKSGDWDDYVSEFERSVLSSPEGSTAMDELTRRAGTERLALLCSEPGPEQCHRRLVVERMARDHPSLTVSHLT